MSGINNSALGVSVVIPTHNDAKRAIALAKALSAQRLPAGAALEIIVVDDGSEADQAGMLQVALDAASLVRLEVNQGRSAARNMGAATATGDWLCFIDCDCLPTADDLVASHLGSLARTGAIAATGHVVGGNGDFWDRYQAGASLRREAQHRLGMHYSGSSQNMVVSRDAFARVGGFSLDYRSYGFEDRDLLIRLANAGPIIWVKHASVRHMDPLDLPTVARKMQLAAGAAAAEFSRAHPRAYRALGYARLDARLHSWLRWPARILRPIVPALARWGDHILKVRMVPYPVAKAYVKLTSAAAFLSGTACPSANGRSGFRTENTI